MLISSLLNENMELSKWSVAWQIWLVRTRIRCSIPWHPVVELILKSETNAKAATVTLNVMKTGWNGGRDEIDFLLSNSHGSQRSHEF